jgi:hypothetical protein
LDAGDTARRTDTAEAQFRWSKGCDLVKSRLPPFYNIWHNSAGNVYCSYNEVAKKKKNEDDDMDEDTDGGAIKLLDEDTAYSGYFDNLTERLREKAAALPGFNKEFTSKVPTFRQRVELKRAVRALLNEESNQATNRGHASFAFFAPSGTQLKGYANDVRKEGPPMGGADKTITKKK